MCVFLYIRTAWCHVCSVCLWTSRHAGWGGKIYLIHDNPACYDLDTLLYRSGMERGMLELVYFNNSYTHSMRGTSGMYYKAKTYR